MVGSRARLFMGSVAIGTYSRKKRLSRSVLLVGHAKSRGISKRRSILERVFQYVSAYINGIFYFLFRSGSLGDGRLPAAFAGTFFVAFGVRDEKSFSLFSFGRRPFKLPSPWRFLHCFRFFIQGFFRR